MPVSPRNFVHFDKACAAISWVSPSQGNLPLKLQNLWALYLNLLALALWNGRKKCRIFAGWEFSWSPKNPEASFFMNSTSWWKCVTPDQKQKIWTTSSAKRLAWLARQWKPTCLGPCLESDNLLRCWYSSVGHQHPLATWQKLLAVIYGK